MNYDDKRLKIAGYIAIIVISFVFLLSVPAAIAEFGLSYRDESSIVKEDLKEGFKFVEARSFVTYKLDRNERAEDIISLFSLNLRKEAFFRVNPELRSMNVIPAGTIVKLFIQSR